MGNITFGPNYTGAAPLPLFRNDLSELFAKARTHVMSPKELYEQKVSWLRGMTGKLSDPMPTREQAIKALAELGIVDPEPSSPDIRERQE